MKSTCIIGSVFKAYRSKSRPSLQDSLANFVQQQQLTMDNIYKQIGDEFQTSEEKDEATTTEVVNQNPPYG